MWQSVTPKYVCSLCLLTLPWPGETDSKFLQSVETWFANLGKLSSDCGDLSGVSCSDAAVSYFHCRPIALFFFFNLGRKFLLRRGK